VSKRRDELEVDLDLGVDFDVDDDPLAVLAVLGWLFAGIVLAVIVAAITVHLYARWAA